MRRALPLGPLHTGSYYRATADPEDDWRSSSSNSPVRADYEESDFYAGNNDSQSSIGVPTFRDMAVSEALVKVAPANQLPAEVLIGIFSKLGNPVDMLSCMRVSKRWARNCVDLLWHRPACTSWKKHSNICRALSLTDPYFPYADFIKRLNLATLADRVNDGSVLPLAKCSRVERLTLTNCVGLTDMGLVALIDGSSHLLALDIAGDVEITEESMVTLANSCPRLQGLNISNCKKISNDSMVQVANKCKYIKRLKLNDCDQLGDITIMAFAENCPNILEIDLHGCKAVSDGPITALLINGQSLRELRLANCERITDAAFLDLLVDQTFEHLRILDLTSCPLLTDRAVAKIIAASPRLRNLVFNKCRKLSDLAVHSISKLGKNLHYLHLGHCGQITDSAVIKLVKSCNRIRYIDLGCCVNLTDDSVTQLASLPKLRRIGLVKCSNITDRSVLALAHATPRNYTTHGLGPTGGERHSGLERVHLSYCTNLTLNGIIVLLNSCLKLTHLSLTGIQAFLRVDLEKFSREAPLVFTEHQRYVFCVFSGRGVIDLRIHLNQQQALYHADDEEHDHETVHDVDDHQAMTGMMGVAILNGDDEDADIEEEELDADGESPDN